MSNYVLECDVIIEGICEVESILKVVRGCGAVQSIPSTLLVWQ